MIASGKGGVGKSLFTAALGIALANRNLPTVAVDGDMGLRNLDLLLGLENRVVYDVSDIVHQGCKLRYAIIQDARHPQLCLLPASQMGNHATLSSEDWAHVVQKLRKRFAYVLIDAPAGVDNGFQSLLPSIDQCLLITTADDIAIRDGERVVSMLDAAQKPRPLLVVNRLRPDWVQANAMYSPQTVASQLDIPLLGFVPEDPAILHALHKHESFMDGEGPAQEAMMRICRRFLGESVPMPSFEKRRSRFRRK